MNHLSILEDVELLYSRVVNVIPLRERFPRGIFQRAPASLAFFDYGHFTSRELFNLLKRLCSVMGEAEFAFLALRPHVKSYYHEKFGWIPAASFSVEDDDLAAWTEFVLHDPGGSPADAIAYRADEFAIISESDSLVAYGTRSSGLATICGWGAPLDIVNDRTIQDEKRILMDSTMAYDYLNSHGNCPLARGDFLQSWHSKRS
jgi:hypothetical protein